MLHQNINPYPYGNVYYSYYFYPIAIAFVSNQSHYEDNQSSLGTDLSIINTEGMTNWTPAKWKKLQHRTKFHEEYQWISRERAQSILS